MNPEQKILVTRLEDAGISTRRFIKLSGSNNLSEEKEPLEINGHEKLYSPEDLKEYHKWGISGGDGLLLIDTDTRELYKIISRLFPPTFEVDSPSKEGRHLYFAVEGKNIKNQSLSSTGNRAEGDVRSSLRRLITPGTVLSCGRYQIRKDRRIAKIEREVYLEKIAPYIYRGKTSGYNDTSGYSSGYNDTSGYPY